MSSNPYEAPSVQSVVTGNMPREELRQIASRQKVILVCILIYLGAVFGQFLVPIQMRPILILAFFAAVLTGAVFVMLMAIRLYGIGMGILLSVLSIIPILGLLVLLRINGKATSILKENGIAVGLMGADMSQL